MQIALIIFAGFILALGISLYAVPIVVHVVRSIRLFDNPNERSAAQQPVLTLGGIAIFISFILVSAVTMDLADLSLKAQSSIFAATLLVFFIGLKDDIVDLSPRKKVLGEILATFIIISLADIRFTHLHGLFGLEEIGIVPSYFLTGFVFIMIINAVNLMDGIDGLASGLTIMAATVFGGWFYLSGHYEYAIISFTLTGSIAGFFYYNVYGKRYKIFMGDTGALMLGLLLTILVVEFNELNISQDQPFAIFSSPGVTLGIILYPILDTVRVFLIRIINRRSPFSADKNHIHHRLLLLGFSHKKSTYIILSVNIGIIFFVFYFRQLGPLRLVGLTTLLGIVLFTIPAYFIRKMGLIHNGDPYQQFLIPELAVDEVGEHQPTTAQDKDQAIGA